MVNSILSICIATILGFLAGLGVGGGSLLLLWLTQVICMDTAQARILNLLFYLPAALVATTLQIKRRTLKMDIILPGLLTGCLSAAIFTMMGRSINTEFAKKLLGCLLIAVGTREVFYRPRNAR